jgi:hypothetical protein
MKQAKQRIRERRLWRAAMQSPGFREMYREAQAGAAQARGEQVTRSCANVCQNHAGRGVCVRDPLRVKI